jgi:hypothetical protein
MTHYMDVDRTGLLWPRYTKRRHLHLLLDIRLIRLGINRCNIGTSLPASPYLAFSLYVITRQANMITKNKGEEFLSS